MTMPRTPIGDRLKSRLQPSATGCLEWTGHVTSNGYGRITSPDGARTRYTHRVAWELAHGRPIPDGMHVCHACDNRRCCNPEHLFLGTRADNMRDMSVKGRSPRGTRNAHAKMNEVAVAQARKMRAEGLRVREIADHFGISSASASLITRGLSWRHVPPSDDCQWPRASRT